MFNLKKGSTAAQANRSSSELLTNTCIDLLDRNYSEAAMYTSLLRTALYMHALLELPAVITFYLKPATHLPEYPADLESRPLNDIERSWIDATEPILHSYGILLLSSSLIAAISAQSDTPLSLARAIGLFLALYHIGPVRRAQARIKRDRAIGVKQTEALPVMKNPKLHMVLHTIVGGMLAGSAIFGYFSG